MVCTRPLTIIVPAVQQTFPGDQEGQGARACLRREECGRRSNQGHCRSQDLDAYSEAPHRTGFSPDAYLRMEAGDSGFIVFAKSSDSCAASSRILHGEHLNSASRQNLSWESSLGCISRIKTFICPYCIGRRSSGWLPKVCIYGGCFDYGLLFLS